MMVGTLTVATASEEDDIPRLIRQLSNPVFQEREAATRALKTLGEPALPSLRAAAASDDPETRLRASKLIDFIEHDIFRVIRCFHGHKSPVWCVCFSKDGNYALSGSGGVEKEKAVDCTVRLWDVKTGKQLREFAGHERMVQSVSFSPDGRLAVSSDIDRARLWDFANGNHLRTFLAGGSKLSPSRDHLLLSMGITSAESLFLNNERVLSGWNIWEAKTGDQLLNLEAWPRATSAISRDGLLLLRGNLSDVGFCGNTPPLEIARMLRSLGVVHVLDVKTGKSVGSLEGHLGCLRAVAFCPDGKHALTAGRDCTVRQWNLRTLKETRCLTVPDCCVCFSQDGRRFLASNEEGTVSVWDVETGREIRCYHSQKLGVCSVAFSPDGQFGLSGSGDGTIKLWRLPK
jgi:WD40 repeat protein